MRITNQMMLRDVLRNIRTLNGSLASATDQVLEGKRILRASDDPVDAARVMRLDHALRATEQYRRNASSGRTRLAVEDHIIESVRDLVLRAKGLALGVASDSPADSERQVVLSEVSLLLDSVIDLGNTRVGNEFLLGGGQTTTEPFLQDGTYVGDTTVRQVEVDDRVYVDVNHTGDNLLGSSIQALQNLVQELQTGSAASIHGAANSLEQVERALLTNQAELGIRERTLDAADSRHAARGTSLLVERDEIQRVDPAEAVVEMMHAQQALERAYAAIGRVLETSLMNHLP